MLARKVVTRSGRKIRGYFPSRKMERMIEWESLLERDAILLMEFSSGIKHYQEQPERIVYYADQDQREYYPDFEISLSGDSVVHIEVKPVAQLQRRKVSDKLSHIFNHYERLGLQFLILTDERIRRQPLLTNLSRLQYFNRPGYPIDGARERYYWCFGHAATTFAEAITELSESAVMTLLAYGVLSCDLEQPYAGTNAIVWKEDGDASILI